jgi:maltooligosyltrehalose trehalohydrolase
MLDPQDELAYTGAILKWDELNEPEHAGMLDFYRQAIALRAAEPDLRNPRLDEVQVDFDESNRWLVVHRGQFRIAINLGETDQVVPSGSVGEIVLATGSAVPVAGGVRLGAEVAAVVRLAR